MLAFFIRQAQGRFTIGAGAVAVGLALFEFILLQAEPALDLAGDLQILLIFHLPLINIFRKDPEKHPDHH